MARKRSPDKVYSYIDHTADLGIRLYGRNRVQLFKNAAVAVFETMLVLGDTRTLETVKQTLLLKADSLSELLVEWLRELLYLFHTKQMVPQKTSIDFRGTRQLKSSITFLQLQQGCFKVKMEVKNVTYHNLRIRSTPTGYTATVIFDV